MPKTTTSWKPGVSGNPGGKPKILREVQELARAQTPVAIATLRTICADKKALASARVSAAIALLDRAWGRPHQSMDVAVNCSLDELSDAELLAIANGADAAFDEDEQKLVN